MRRLVRKVLTGGERRIIHGSRGKPSNRRIPDETKGTEPSSKFERALKELGVIK